MLTGVDAKDNNSQRGSHRRKRNQTKTMRHETTPLAAAEAAAELLLGARRDARPIPTLPEALRPHSVAAAYAIQDATLRRLGSIGGWKAGPPKPDGTILCAPIPAALIFDSPAELPALLAPSPEIEVELAIRLGKDLLPGTGTPDPERVRRAVTSVHVAAELVWARFTDRDRLDPLLPLADCQSNAAVILGPVIGDADLLDFEHLTGWLRIDGVPAGEDRDRPSGPTVLRSLAWLAGHAAERGAPLRAGQLVITGARIGPLPFRPGTRVEAALGGGAPLALRVIAASHA